jgi:hypothetical protein
MSIMGAINMTNVGYAWILAEIAQDGDHFSASTRICGLEQKGNPEMIIITIPQAYLDSLPVVDKPFYLDGTSFSQPKVVELSGLDAAMFEDLEKDSLPKKGSGAEDERVQDWDEDGKPGLTVHAKGKEGTPFIDTMEADLYVVQRYWSELDGEMIDENRVSGLVKWNMEQVTLGASEGGDLFMSASPTQTPAKDATKSFFRMVRMADTTNCADILAAKETLFDF